MRSPQTILITLWLAGGAVFPTPASPFATEVIQARGPFGPAPNDDAAAVLGAPATWFYDPLGAFSGGSTNRRVKLIEGAYNVAANTNGLVTPKLLVTMAAGSEIIVRFDHRIYDDPAHPYGLDLLVFGNSFYPSAGFVSDSANLSTLPLTGGAFFEPVRISVSPGYTGQPGEVAEAPETWQWYRYENGPYGDTDFPTEAFKWNRATTNWSTELMDFTKPVNPAMKAVISAGGLSAADAADLYAGSGGGTGFDLREAGLAWIQYVKLEGIDPDFSDGEIDALAAVRPMSIGDTLTVAPENISSNAAILVFQESATNEENVVALAFTALSDLAQVSTAAADDLSAYGPVPGAPLTAVNLALSPILGINPVAFVAKVTLTTGTNYSGPGTDLLVLQAVGTNWHCLPFTYQATNRSVSVSGVTSLSTFLVTQLVAPTLQLTVNGASHQLAFTPVIGISHTLERSTNLVNWSVLNAFTASNSQPVVVADPTAPSAQAFYRIKLSLP